MTEAEKLKNEALRRLADEKESLRVWFRRKYNLPPTDPRFLEVTDREIMVDWLIDRELKEEAEREAKKSLPVCTTCGYIGFPVPRTLSLCPACGAEMTLPDDSDDAEGNQTVYADEDTAQSLRDLGLNPDEIKKSFQ